MVIFIKMKFNILYRYIVDFCTFFYKVSYKYFVYFKNKEIIYI